MLLYTYIKIYCIVIHLHLSITWPVTLNMRYIILSCHTIALMSPMTTSSAISAISRAFASFLFGAAYIALATLFCIHSGLVRGTICWLLSFLCNMVAMHPSH